MHEGGRIKLALVITELSVGGAERCLVNLATRIPAEGFEPAVFVLAPPPRPPRDDLLRQLHATGIECHFLGLSRSWQLASAVRQLHDQLRRYAPHVVQSMLFHANVVTGLALSRSAPPAWCAGMRVADPSRWRALLERLIVSRARQVVCVSERVAQYVEQRMNLSPERLSVIANGIDVESARQQPPADLQKLGLPRGRRAITCVARLARQKGIDLLLEAAPQFLDALPTHDLLLVGDGPLWQSMQRRAGRLPQAERVHLCGWQPHVGAILRASDLLVLPSRWEGMPNVILEAMARSLPVVSTQVEGVQEALGDLAEAQTVPPQKPDLLADRIVQLLASPTLARHLGQSNYQRVAAVYSLTSMVQRYAKLYQNVC